MRPAKSESPKKAEPLKINLQKLAIENGAVRYTKAHDATHKDVSEIAPLNVSLAKLQNWQTGKLTVNSLIKVLMNPPAPATNGTLEAKLDGAFDLALSADAIPASIQGTAKLFNRLTVLTGVRGGADDERTEVRPVTGFVHADEERHEAATSSD